MSSTEYFELPGAIGTLRGVIHHGSSGPQVVVLHGYFSSNKIGPYRLYFELAEALSRRGATVVRVDLSGMGESDGRIEDVRYEHHVLDFELVREALRVTSSSDDLHVVAHCAGCHIPLSAERPDDLRSLTLVAPFAGGERGFGGTMFTMAQWDELRATGSTLRKGWYCHRSFFDSNDVLQRPLSATLRKKTHVILAGKDELTPLAESERWAEAQQVRHTSVPTADHNFTTRAAREQLFDLVARTVFRASGTAV
ncbi:alpha/beta hydrolase [Micromonospora trifolii]|uniref:alpha/beta hydrolase n=1 Tax=Micromonospora trifolii TaxID=2911208 RepID=UPI003CE717F7